MHHTEGYLAGQFLIAAPGIKDERFEKTVLYIYRHDEDGATGLIINQPCENIDFHELCEQLSIPVSVNCSHVELYDGGPVEGNRGYVLHTDDFIGRDTHHIQGTNLSVTTTVDVLRRIAEGTGPNKALITLGCAIWQKGQLEDELTRHGWLHDKASNDILFSCPHKKRWERTIQNIGIHFAGLAQYTGTA